MDFFSGLLTRISDFFLGLLIAVNIVATPVSPVASPTINQSASISVEQATSSTVKATTKDTSKPTPVVSNTDQIPSEITWKQANDLIQGCRVASIIGVNINTPKYQKIYLTLKTGQKIQLSDSPSFGEVKNNAELVSEKCGAIKVLGNARIE
jgi:hypothetical protein